MPKVVTCAQFTDFLSRKAEHLDAEIIKDINPIDSLIGYFESGQFPAYGGVEHSYDRFHRVMPQLTGGWKKVSDQPCIGKPCDKVEKKIGFGYSRGTYSLYEDSHATDLFCFDLAMTADRAQEQFTNIVGQLGQASNWIMSNRIRMEMLRNAGKTWLADATMSNFTFTFDEAEEVLTVSGEPTSKLTSEMLQRRVTPLIYAGYFGKNVLDTTPTLELMTDVDTLWQCNRQTTVNDKWRFTQFEAAAKEYYKYGWTGMIGNYMVKADLFPMRFFKTGANTFKRVFPYKKADATKGIKWVEDTNYDLAPFQISFIPHRKAMKMLGFSAEAVNPAMPFALRDFGGKWQFVMDNLGVDAEGCVIENKRRNKGQFISDYRSGTKPGNVEFMEAIFHKREPIAITVVNTAATPNYVGTPDFTANNAPCPDVLTFTPTIGANSVYNVAANSVKCNGVPLTHAAVGGTNIDTISELVTSLNTNLGSLGTWAAGANGTVTLTGSTCGELELAWS